MNQNRIVPLNLGAFQFRPPAPHGFFSLLSPLLLVIRVLDHPRGRAIEVAARIHPTCRGKERTVSEKSRQGTLTLWTHFKFGFSPPPAHPPFPPLLLRSPRFPEIALPLNPVLSPSFCQRFLPPSAPASWPCLHAIPSAATPRQATASRARARPFPRSSRRAARSGKRRAARRSR